jgi:transposase InsO family protein
MPDTTPMTVNERRKCLQRIQLKYLAADRPTQGQILDLLTEQTGLHRKSLVRLLHATDLRRHPRTRPRGRVYGIAVDDALRIIWESLDYICAERLTPTLVSTARLLAHHGELELTEVLEEQLRAISIPTVHRRLMRLSQDAPRLPRKGPERANQVARVIPMTRIPWSQSEPGHCEVDLVHHCGPVTAGQYVHTLQLIDVATGWSERVGVLGRGQQAMETGFRRIVERMPFLLKELHSDNGSEFLNDHLVRFWGTAITGLELSRSHPYQKNDNRFVEQKNDTLVRAYLGNQRLDSVDHCAHVNALYDQMWVYYNLFQPVLHLIEKTSVGNRVRRKWDDAQTPYQRLRATGCLDATTRDRLDLLITTTNPRALRRQIYAGLDALLTGIPTHTEVAA